VKKIIAELRRRNVLKAALSYVIVSWVALQAASIIFPILDFSERASKLLLIFLVVGFPFWIIFAYLFEWTPGGFKKTGSIGEKEEEKISETTSKRLNKIIIAGLSIALVLLVVDKMFNVSGIEPINLSRTSTIAVFPFSNLSPHEDNAFFVSGVYEDVMNKLSTIKHIRVVARRSVMTYADFQGDLSEAADRLDVDYILEGSVRRVGNEVRITANMVDGSTNQTVWTRTYDRQLENIFELQASIAKEIAANLELELSPNENADLSKVPTVVVEAYDAYLKGREIMHRSNPSYPEILEAISHYEKAVDIDPEFGRGWSALARAEISHLYMVQSYDDREEEARETLNRIENAMDEARKLISNSAELFKLEGIYAIDVDNDKMAAVRSFDKSLELNPDDGQLLVYQSQLYFMLGQPKESLECIERAYELDKENGSIVWRLTNAYEILGKFREMVPVFERLARLEPEKTHYQVQAKYYKFLSEGSLQSFQEFDEAVKTVEKNDFYDDRKIHNMEMVTSIFNGDFTTYHNAWQGKWDAHHSGHGNWSCPMIINEELNHAHLIVEHSDKDAEAAKIIEEAKNAVERPVNENSICIFDKIAYLPKLYYLDGDTDLAKQAFNEALIKVFENHSFPRGSVERAVILEAADMIVPEQVYKVYRRVVESDISFIHMENICANPWIFPNLINHPDFIAEVRADGRFVEFLESYGYLSSREL
jgi:TolB-like protein